MHDQWRSASLKICSAAENRACKPSVHALAPYGCLMCQADPVGLLEGVEVDGFWLVGRGGGSCWGVRRVHWSLGGWGALFRLDVWRMRACEAAGTPSPLPSAATQQATLLARGEEGEECICSSCSPLLHARCVCRTDYCLLVYCVLCTAYLILILILILTESTVI